MIDTLEVVELRSDEEIDMFLIEHGQLGIVQTGTGGDTFF